MISLALLLGLLGIVPAASGLLFMLGHKRLPHLAAVIWCVVVLLFCLAVVLLLIHFLSFGGSFQATAFAPSGWARWLQLSYQVDAFNIFSALVIGVLASALAALLIAIEPVQTDAGAAGEQPGQQPGSIGRQSRTWQVGVLLIGLGAIFTLIFANSALWLVLGWCVVGLCAFILYVQGQARRQALLLLATPCLAAIALYLALLPAITTREDQRLDVLSGLGREPFWAALVMLLALLAPGVVLLIQQISPAQAPRPAGMGQSSAYALMASPGTFTAFARLALLIAGPGSVAPGTGSTGWVAFSLQTVWAVAALALAAAVLALRQARRASLPLFLSIQLLGWMWAGVAVTGLAALNGALLFKLLRFLALGALLLAGGRKSTQPILNISWWLAVLALGALPFFPAFSGAWLITTGAVAAGPAWLAATGVNWFALLLATLAMVRVGSTARPDDAKAPPGAISQNEPGPSFLLFLLALLALAVGIAPEAVVSYLTGPAASVLPGISSSAAGVQSTPLGLASPTGSWLAGLFWLLLTRSGCALPSLSVMKSASYRVPKNWYWPCEYSSGS